MRRRASPFHSVKAGRVVLSNETIYLGEEHHNRFHIDAALTVLRRLVGQKDVRRPWPWKCLAGTASLHWINMCPG